MALGSDISVRLGSKSLTWEHCLQGWSRCTVGSLLASEKFGYTIPKDIDKLSDRIDWISKLRKRRDEMTWAASARMVECLECSDLRDRVFGILGILDPRLRFYPDYSMQPQDILLRILAQEMEFIAAQSTDRHLQEHAGGRLVSLASKYFDIFADWGGDAIDAALVRRHLFEFLPNSPIPFKPLIPRAWQLRLYLRHEIPNVRSEAWRRLHYIENSPTLHSKLLKIWNYKASIRRLQSTLRSR